MALVFHNPCSAIRAAGVATDVEITDCTFDGGLYGWKDDPALASTVGAQGFAVDFTAAAITRIKAQGLTLLSGADIGLHTDSTGWVQISTATGGARVVW